MVDRYMATSPLCWKRWQHMPFTAMCYVSVTSNSTVGCRCQWLCICQLVCLLQLLTDVPLTADYVWHQWRVQTWRGVGNDGALRLFQDLCVVGHWWPYARVRPSINSSDTNIPLCKVSVWEALSSRNNAFADFGALQILLPCGASCCIYNVRM